MHLKTHFKVLFHSSKISKTIAHIIFLLNTRPYQELNKIGTITFGSTKLELHIFESIHKSWEKQLNKTKKGKPNSTAGPARQIRRPANTHWRVPKCGSAQASSRLSLSGWQGGPARQREKQGRKNGRWRSSSPVASPAKATALLCSSHSCASSGTLNGSYWHGY